MFELLAARHSINSEEIQEDVGISPGSRDIRRLHHHLKPGQTKKEGKMSMSLPLPRPKAWTKGGDNLFVVGIFPYFIVGLLAGFFVDSGTRMGF